MNFQIGPLELMLIAGIVVMIFVGFLATRKG